VVARPVYLGPSSCYAVREGRYVAPKRGRGVDTLDEALGILKLIEWEVARGWTYDPRRNCRKTRMTRALAERRARFLVALARRHGGQGLARRVARIVDEFIKNNYRVPKKYNRRAIAWLARAARRRP